MINNVVNLGGDMQNYKSQTKTERDNYQYIGPSVDSLDDML